MDSYTVGWTQYHNIIIMVCQYIKRGRHMFVHGLRRPSVYRVNHFYSYVFTACYYYT